jgi:hypothetical protein
MASAILIHLAEIALLKIIEEIAERAERNQPIPRSKISEALRRLKEQMDDGNLTLAQKAEIIRRLGEILEPLYKED